MKPDLDMLSEVAVGAQVGHIDAYRRHGTVKKAACALGINQRTLERSVAACKKKAAVRGFSPEHDLNHPVAPGQSLRGASTLYDADGNLVMQWVKSQADAEKLQKLMEEVAEAMSATIPKEKRVPKPKKVADDLLNLYVITDYHLGMYAWHEESGADWDIKIAEDLLVNWFSRAIASSPDAKVGVLAQLGDFLHFDGMDAVTPVGNNLLDADTRFEKVVRVAIRALRRIVRMLLEKHELVHIIMAEGNHDPASSVWLREWFAALYEDEPRVTVDQSPDPYYAYEFGAVSLYVHHGHKRSAAKVDEVFVAKFKPLFGRTKHAYGHTGHVHHASLHESSLMTVEGHRTLASPDAYASRGGWSSGRGASCISYHWEHGEVGRVVVTPEMCGC